MTALLIFGAATVVISAALYAWVISTRRREDAWNETAHDVEVLTTLAAERARQAMRERLIHKRIKDGRR